MYVTATSGLTLIISFQDGWSPLGLADLVAGFLVLVAVFFAFGEASGEDKSDDMLISRRKWGKLDYSDGRQR